MRSRYPESELEILTLVNQDATRERVVAGLTGHLTQAGPRDSALFWFSGHGGSVRIDGTDLKSTMLVTTDFTKKAPTGVYGPELVALLNDVAAGARHVVAVVDACHATPAAGAEPPMPERGMCGRSI